MSKLKLIKKFFITYGAKKTYPKNSLIPALEFESKILFLSRGHVSGGFETKGKRLIRYIYSAGEIIQLEQIIGIQRNDITYATMSNTDIYSLDASFATEYFKNDQKLLIELLKLSAYQTTLRAERTENLMYRYASDRVIYRILFLAEKFGTNTGGSSILTVKQKHHEIGLSIGLTRESTTRELNKLMKAGLISFEGKKMIVHDFHKLIEAFHEKLRTDWATLSVN